MTKAKILKNGEGMVVELRSLYKKYGYLPFKMSKFEEYELYVKNKEFLVGDNVITFNDTDGRLLALKPDVTLSIIKNTVYEKGCKQKVYYNENIYRVSKKTHRFKEIMQAGLECIGDIDIFDKYEAIYLAAKSLSLVSSDFVLDVSHLGIISKLICLASDSETFKSELTSLISEKNKHEIEAVCRKYSVSEDYIKMICSVVDMYGNMSDVLKKLYPICEKIGAIDLYSELSAICDLLQKSEFKDKIALDFSVVNDMNYYNGTVFRGFLKGIPEGVLSGGEYSTLVNRMGKPSGAVGFAMYLDLLEELTAPTREFDVDVLIVYDGESDVNETLLLKNKLISEGKSVSLQKAVPSKLRYKEIIRLDENKK